MLLQENKIYFTEEAKEIFGDIVDYAYLVKPEWLSSEEFDETYVGIKQNIRENSHEIKVNGALPIFINLLNGKSFTLWTTEICGVSSKSEEDYLKEINQMD
ncbi:hypothetical protein [Bacillus altitudinis]